ncbi:MAG: hypothetical protein ACKVHE_07135 [Planctomycetales bacterium]|jgi:hypothetical protein
MLRQKKKPSYLVHKPSGQANRRLNGRIVYLGKYGTSESKDQYDEAVASWLEGQSSGCFTLTIDELALDELTLKYIEHRESYYAKNGEPTSEVGKALRPNRGDPNLFCQQVGPPRLGLFC